MRPVTRMVVMPRPVERADRLDGERSQPLAAVEQKREKGPVEIGGHHPGRGATRFKSMGHHGR